MKHEDETNWRSVNGYEIDFDALLDAIQDRKYVIDRYVKLARENSEVIDREEIVAVMFSEIDVEFDYSLSYEIIDEALVYLDILGKEDLGEYK